MKYNSLRSFNQLGLMGSTQMRMMHRAPNGQNYWQADAESQKSVPEVVKFLDKQRPTFTLLYFTAAWNPKCAEIEKDYENLCASTGAFTHIRVDCDTHWHLKRYFDARVEPQFLFLINGGEVKRQIGYNFDLIESLCEKVVQAHSTNEFGYAGDTGATWERFYDHFDKWARYGENDRDAFRARYDSQVDQHRGPGTDYV